MILTLAVGAACCRPTHASEVRALGAKACERELVSASLRSSVPLAVAYAVSLTESGARGVLHPFALNIAGAPSYPATLGDAIAKVRDAQRSGVTLIDIGCMQINMRFHGHRFVSIQDMFDPAKNVGYGLSYLKALRARTKSWTDAVALYHAGPDNAPAQTKYLCNVVRNMISAGLGGWTQPARTFCDSNK